MCNISDLTEIQIRGMQFLRLSSLIEAALRRDRKIDRCFRAIFVIRLLYYFRFSLLSLHPLHPLIEAAKPRVPEKNDLARFSPRAREVLSSREPGRDDDVFFLSLSLPPPPRSCVFLQSVFSFNAPLLSAFPLCVRAKAFLYATRCFASRQSARACEREM